IAVVKRIERRNIALAGYAEYVLRPVHDQLVDQNFSGRPRSLTGAHHASPMILLPVPEHAASAQSGQIAMLARADTNCSKRSELSRMRLSTCGNCVMTGGGRMIAAQGCRA